MSEILSAKHPLFEAKNITKYFGDFKANDDISLHIYPGEILALLGENGAGKSTFVKMMYGLLAPDQGELNWLGQPIALSNPQHAREMGIGMVFQHFSLFEMLTVAENIELALPEITNREELSQLIAEKSSSYGIPLNPSSLVADLSVSQRQRVEIVRCLMQDPKLLILDEPTSVLTPQEATQLFDVIEKLAASGCAILFISHKLEEVKALTDRAVILRGGRKVADVKTQDYQPGQLATLMVGETVTRVQPQPAPKLAQNRFRVEGISKPASGAFSIALKNIEIDVKAGEILGIAGVAGNGQTELMDLLTGEWLDPSLQDKITVFADDNTAIDVTQMGPSNRRLNGICCVPEERNGHAAVPDMSLVENALLTSHHIEEASKFGQINTAFCADFSTQIAADFDVRLPKQNPLAGQLSGGNLQKFVVGREMLKNPAVFIVSQPTWGVDVGAAMIIRKAMVDMAKKGAAIVMISQDLEEIFSISHYISVLHDGQLSKRFLVSDLTAEKVGLLMGGAL